VKVEQDFNELHGAAERDHVLTISYSSRSHNVMKENSFSEV